MGSNRNTLYPRAALSRLLSCISGNQDNKKPRLSDQESGNKDVTLTSDNIVTERSHPYTITHLLTVEEVKERIARKEVFFSAPFSCTEENDQTTFQVMLKFGAEENDWLSVDLVSLNRTVVVHGYTFTILDINLKKQRSNSEKMRRTQRCSSSIRNFCTPVWLPRRCYKWPGTCCRCRIDSVPQRSRTSARKPS